MEVYEQQPLEGGFNSNYFILDTNNTISLRRVPVSNIDLLENIIFEFRYIGFTGDGGRIGRRSLEEQVDFSVKAQKAGLKVLPARINDDNMIMPFINDLRTMDVFLQDKETDELSKVIAIFKVIEDMKRAHNLGFVYGDRWSGNIAILHSGDPLHLDFDIELSGPFAREVDMAQLLYHILWADKEEVTQSFIKGLLFSGLNDYDFSKLTKYLKGFASFFEKTHVGDMEESLGRLLDSVFVARSTKNIGAIILSK